MCARKDSLPQSTTASERERPCAVAPRNHAAHAQEIATTMGWFLLRHLNRVRVAFDGDFMLAIILGEIAHHNVCRYYSSGRRIRGVRGVDYEHPDGFPRLQACNAYSLSNATGIPRETVRRKADKLVKQGWVTRDPKGGFLVTPQAARHFSADFNVRSLADLLETSDELRSILARDAGQDA